MNSRRCSKTTLRWSFITLSYFRMFLRMSKLRASTFRCAFSMALLIQGWTIASSSLRPSFCSMPSMRSEPKMRIRSSCERQVEFRAPGIALAAGAAAQLVVDAPALMALGADRRRGRRPPSTFCLNSAISARIRPPRPARSVALGMPRARCAMRISALPPSWMSVPRPAMLVAMVTAPGHAGLGDDVGLLLVEARVQHGEELGRPCPRAPAP